MHDIQLITVRLKCQCLTCVYTCWGPLDFHLIDCQRTQEDTGKSWNSFLWVSHGSWTRGQSKLGQIEHQNNLGFGTKKNEPVELLFESEQKHEPVVLFFAFVFLCWVLHMFFSPQVVASHFIKLQEEEAAQGEEEAEVVELPRVSLSQWTVKIGFLDDLELTFVLFVVLICWYVLFFNFVIVE